MRESHSPTSFPLRKDKKMSNFFSERKKDDRKLFIRMGILSCTINEPIVAWRVFVIRREQNEILLRSIVKSYTYEVINTCELDQDKLGFYSVKLACLEEAVRIYGAVGDTCIGRVTPYGDVIEHEKGYRSSALRLDKIYLILPSYIFDKKILGPNNNTTLNVENSCEVEVLSTRYEDEPYCEQITINNKLYNIKTFTKRKDAIAFVIEKEKEEYGLLSSS